MTRREGRGVLNRWLRETEELSLINIHNYRWLVVVAQKNLEKLMERKKRKVAGK